MFPNRLKQHWAEERPALNGWCSIGNTLTAEIMAAQGFDSITIDLQHGALDYGEMLPMLQVMRASGTVLLVRVPWLEPGIIMKTLDAGAHGIICPMINSAEDCARLVSYVRYPPLGQRSFGPTRAAVAAGTNYAGQANDQILVFAMLETAESLSDLESIAATAGLDGIYVGPADLTLSLRNGRLLPGFDREEEDFIEILKRVVSTCKSRNIRSALHCGTPDYAARAVDWGFDMVTIGSDVRFLSSAAINAVSSFTRLVEGNDLASG